MGLKVPRVAFAEVYINYDDGPLEPEHYEGVYLLAETIKNAKERLDLQQLRQEHTTLPEISGGYIFKFEWSVAEEPIIECSGSEPFGGSGFNQQGGEGSCWSDLEVADPNPLNAEQEAWLTRYIQQFHDSLHSAPLGDYANYIDVPSFVDHFIVNELTRDIDAYTRSAYLHKDRDAPIFAGPLWDYNFAMGIGVSSGTAAVGWQYETREATNDWWIILASDPAFVAQVEIRWQELRQTLLSDAAIAARIAELAAPLAAAAARDFERWPPDEVSFAPGFLEGPEDSTWQGQLEALESWLVARSAWLDTQWGA
jgi:hypothetical protein